LAKQLFKLFTPENMTIPVPPKLGERIIIVVGSLAKNSQTQFTELRNVGTLSVFSLGAPELRTPVIWQEQFQQTLDSRKDLAVGIDAGAVADPDRTSELMADLVAPILTSAGALVVTGGGTCRLLLERLGISKLQLLQELAPGIALAFVATPRPLLLIVKAGGFGGPGVLREAYDFLKKVRT
jgi:uncharacterized protein YgbK (DUF1537 family)